MKKIIDLIPEEDKICINCKYFSSDCCEENGRPCKNSAEAYYKAKDGIIYENNYFEQDDDYIKNEIAACENCEHYGGGDQDWDICVKCSRYGHDDLWEPAYE